MKKLDEKFVRKIYEEVIDDNLTYYKSAYDNLEISEDLPAETKADILFVQSLSNENKTIFHAHMKQVMIDTISNLFGIIDGSSYLEGFNDGDFELKYGAQIKSTISGDLQDLFLEHVEENQEKLD